MRKGKQRGKSLRVLILEDSPTDAELIEHELRVAGFELTVRRVYDRDSFLEALKQFSAGIILSDYLLPAFDGEEALRLARERAADVPFIFVTGALGEERSVDLLKSGATDFVLKNRLARLSLCVERALEEVAEKRRRRQAEEKLRRANAGLEREVTKRIGELQRSMVALRASGEEWQRTFNAVPELITVLDSQYRIKRANQAMAERLGLTPEQCIGLTCYRAVHGTEKPPDFCPHSRTLENGWANSAEVHEPCLGGDFLITTTPLLNPEGQIVGTVHVAHDITEIKSAEQERQTTADFLALVNVAPGTRELVREAAAFFRERSGFSSVGIRVRDGDDFPYYETLGFSAEFIREECSLYRSDDAGNPRLECMCGNVILGRFAPDSPCYTAYGSFWTNNLAELPAPRAEAGLAGVGPDGAPGEGCPFPACSSCRSFTRGRCHEEKFQSMVLLPLVAGNQRLGLLQLGDRRAGLVTPTGIALWEWLAGRLAAALAKLRAEEELRELNEILEYQVTERTAMAESRARQLQALAVQLIEAEEIERRRIAELLHDDLQQILASARLQLQAAQQVLPRDALLSGVEKLLGESIQKSRRLSHDLSPPILHHAGLGISLEWLSRQMEEQYGLKVILEAGEVEMEAGAAEERSLKAFLFRSVQELLFNVVKHARVLTAHIRLDGSDGRLEVTVSDSGIGFDPGVLRPSTGSPIGFGLLSIHERIQAIGGTLSIDSAPGRGSRIKLTVPRARPQSEAGLLPAQAPPGTPEVAGPSAPATSTPGAVYRVLIVDDHKVMRQGLISMIDGQPDIQVVGEAANGREAIELARELSPDVIVMDVSMPEMDGLEATRRIKKEMPRIRVIGLSMLDEQQITTMFCQAGAEAFVSKTDSAGSLLRAIYGLAAAENG